MSSILEALRELEGSDSPTTQHASEWSEERSPALRAVAVGLVLVAVGGAIAAALLWGGGGTASREPGAPPETAGALAPVAPAPPLPTAVLDADPPRARVASREAGAAAIAAAPEQATPVAPAQQPKRPATTRAALGPPRPAGEPRVHVAALNYAARAEDRAVALSINGGGAVMLHEGESAGGVEVQLILRDSVYVRHAGQIFAVPTRD